MRLPWVSRELYEHADQGHRLACEAESRAAERLVDEQRRFDALLAKYHELAMPKTPAVPAPVVIEHEPPDAVTKVIREQAGRDPKLLAHFRQYARDLKAQGKTEDQIIGALVAWQTSELSEGL